jgi:hypothetical protein
LFRMAKVLDLRLQRVKNEVEKLFLNFWMKVSNFTAIDLHIIL